MDDVFKALADPTRRALLDELFRRDGQSLGELEAPLAMSRFGVAKHLKLLSDAGLVVPRRQGRHTLHFLNPVPIRLIHDRWVSKYAETWAAGLSDLKTTLERNMEKVYEIYIRTTPERLWQAIIDDRARFTFGARMVGDLVPGGSFEMRARPDGSALLGTGDYVEIDPPRRLVQTMRALFSDEAAAEGTTRITWTIEQVADSCRLLVVHDEMREGACEEIYGGWPMILSGLKTWIETGTQLTTPGSLLYS